MSFQTLDLFGNQGLAPLGITNCSVGSCNPTTLFAGYPCFNCSDYPFSFTFDEVMKYRWNTKNFRYMAYGSVHIQYNATYSKNFVYSFDSELTFDRGPVATKKSGVMCGGGPSGTSVGSTSMGAYSGSGYSVGSNTTLVVEGFQLNFSNLKADRPLVNASDYTAAKYFPILSFHPFNHLLGAGDVLYVVCQPNFEKTTPVGKMRVLGKTVDVYGASNTGSYGVFINSYNITITASTGLASS